MPSNNTQAQAPRHLLIYINQVDPGEWTGQGGFERGITRALRRLVTNQHDKEVAVVSIYTPGEERRLPTDGPETTRIHLDKSSRLSYALHQVQLGFVLTRLLWRHRKDEVAIFARYNPSMVTPPLLATLFRRPYAIRSGPFGTFEHQRFRIVIPRLAIPFLRALAAFNFSTARHIVVVSPVTGRSLVEEFPFVANKLVLVRNGVDPEQFAPTIVDRESWGLPPAVPVVGYVGHINDVHDLDTVVKAFALVSPVDGVLPWLLMVGDGPTMENLQSLCEEHAIADRVVWTGRQPQSRIPSAISACDIMLAPMTKHSRDFRGASMIKTYEYLACDRRIVAVKTPDHDFIEENGVGWLADAEDQEDWARAISIALRAPVLGHSPRELAIRDHSFDRTAARVWDAAFGGPVERPVLPPTDG